MTTERSAHQRWVDVIIDVESFLAQGGEPVSDYFLDEKGRLWFRGCPVLGEFSNDELCAIYGDKWQQIAGNIASGDDLWLEPWKGIGYIGN